MLDAPRRSPTLLDAKPRPFTLTEHGVRLDPLYAASTHLDAQSYTHAIRMLYAGSKSFTLSSTPRHQGCSASELRLGRIRARPACGSALGRGFARPLHGSAPACEVVIRPRELTPQRVAARHSTNSLERPGQLSLRSKAKHGVDHDGERPRSW